MEDYTVLNINNNLNINVINIVIYNNISFENLKKNINEKIVKDFFNNTVNEVHITTQNEFNKKKKGKVIIFKK